MKQVAAFLAAKKKKAPKKSNLQSLFSLVIATVQVDDKEVNSLFETFKDQLTLDQVRNTLQANKGDKAKTIIDL